MKTIKIMLLGLIVFFLGSCTNGEVPVEEANKSESPKPTRLFLIEDRFNYLVMLLRYDSSEYILVSGNKGVAITKHK